VSHDAGPAADWASYWRSPDEPLEAMHAHFRGHVYHRHSHDCYSFGVTESGAQGFTCRRAGHVSTAGMVMAFNPEDPHDGHAATGPGFTYRMIHVGPEFLTDLLADMTGRPAARPLFASPVLDDAAVARAVQRLHAALTGAASPLERSERLMAAAALLVRRGATRPPAPAAPLATAASSSTGAADAARRIRAFLHDEYASQVSGTELAAVAGRSRYAAYRAFQASYGLAPSAYQRQLRLRAARRLLAGGVAPADAAAVAGFADQAHLTRWFRRCYGITPGAYRRAAVDNP
jgi:AraC-like DNA-binding protein